MSHESFLLLSCAFICAGFTWKPVSSAFTETPNDTIALLHSRATLKCKTNLTTPIDWYFDQLAEPKEKFQIYLNEALTEKLKDKFKFDKSVRGTYELIMESVDWWHVGTYMCHDDAGIGVNASVKFTVLDPNPRWNIRSSKKNEQSFPCSSLDFQFSYFGNQTPSLQWNSEEKLQIQNGTTFFDPKSTHKIPSTTKFINFTMDLCEQWNGTNYYIVCAWKTIQNSEDMKDEVATSTISLQQMQSKTTIIVALQCRSIPVPIFSHSSFSEERSGLLTWQAVFITATVLSVVIVLLVLHIIVNRRSHHSFWVGPTGMKSVDITTSSVDVNTSSAATIAEFPYESQYENIPNDTPPLSPLSLAAISLSAMSNRGQWNPVYNAHWTALPGSAQVSDSRRSPEGQEAQRPSEDRTPLSRMNRRDQSRGSDYLEIIA